LAPATRFAAAARSSLATSVALGAI
jgi:hypothetical protein